MESVLDFFKRMNLSPEVALIIAGMIVVIGVLWARSGRYYQRRQREDSSDRLSDRFEQVRESHGMAHEAETLEVQLEEVIRETNAHIDTKLRLLQLLIEDADKAADRLERALKASQGKK